MSNATTDGVPRKMLTAGPGFCVTLSTSLTLCCELLQIFMSLPHTNGEGIGDAIGKLPRTGYKYDFNKQSIVNVILKKTNWLNGAAASPCENGGSGFSVRWCYKNKREKVCKMA